jgi:imidazolonepropionase-like amidohydrolase
MRFTGLGLRQALETGTVNAAKGCGLESRMGFLQPGDAADLILFDYDPDTKAVEVRETIVG